jgi:hypothetical protein
MYVQVEKRSTVQKPQPRWIWVRWPDSTDAWYRRSPPRRKLPKTRLVFRLVRSVRTERGSRPVLVAELGRIDIARLHFPLWTEWLWKQIDQRLAAHAVSDAEAARIRERIAQHVPRPSPGALAEAEAEHERQLLEILRQPLLRRSVQPPPPEADEDS